MQHTELDVVLLLDELEYPEAEHSEDEHCGYHVPMQWPSSLDLPVEHACVQWQEPYQAASETMEMYGQLMHTVMAH
jgi:hypothetical protein